MKVDGIILPESAVKKQTLHFRDSEDLIILAKGDSMVDGLAMARDKGCECWGLNDMRYPELTMLFELHERERWENYSKDLHKLDIPVMMQETHIDIPTSIKFPMEPIIDEFGITYFNNQVCQMIAFAIQTKRFKNIYLFGVDYRGTERPEQEFERPCTEFWMGIAVGRGCQIFCAKESNMFTYVGYIKGVTYCYSPGYAKPFEQFKEQMPHLWAEYILGHYQGRSIPKQAYSHEDWMEELAKFCTEYVHKCHRKALEMNEQADA